MLMEIQKREIVSGYKNTLLMPKNICTSFNPLEPPLLPQSTTLSPSPNPIKENPVRTEHSAYPKTS